MKAPTYKHKPYVLLNPDGMVMSAGTLDEVKSTVKRFGSYYDNCAIQAREHDLYLNDNTKIENTEGIVIGTWND